VGAACPVRLLEVGRGLVWSTREGRVTTCDTRCCVSGATVTTVTRDEVPLAAVSVGERARCSTLCRAAA
jgi:hypothetical protein